MMVAIDLSTHAWRPASQAWEVSVLALPGAKLVSVQVDGTEVASSRYRVDGTQLKIEEEGPGAIHVRVEVPPSTRRRDAVVLGAGAAVGIALAIAYGATGPHPTSIEGHGASDCTVDLHRLGVLAKGEERLTETTVQNLTRRCLDVLERAQRDAP